MSALAHFDLVPVLPLREANAFHREHHRHHGEDRGRSRERGRLGALTRMAAALRALGIGRDEAEPSLRKRAFEDEP